MRYLKVDPSSGIWQFRFKIPTYARFMFGVTEITRSLRTTSKKLATIQALRIEMEVKQKIMDVEQSPIDSVMQALRSSLKKYVDQFFDPSSKEAHEARELLADQVSEISDDEGVSEVAVSLVLMSSSDLYLDDVFPRGKTPHEEAYRVFEYLIERGGLSQFLTQEDALELMQLMVLFYTKRKKLREFLSDGDFTSAYALWADILDYVVEPPTSESSDPTYENLLRSTKTQPTLPTKTNLDKVLRNYELEKKNKNVSDKTINAVLTACKVVHQLIEKDNISLVEREDANNALVLARKLPNDPYHKKHKGTFDNKTPLEWLHINARFKAQLISEATANRYIERCSSVYRWAKLNNLITYNPFEGLATRRSKTQKATSLKAPFDKSDIKHIFQNRNYKKPWQKWIPLIALYTGMRPNEICQLLRSDIKQIGDIWCFDLKVTTEKQSLKNINASRIIPIHSKLLESNLIDFVNESGSCELFHELSYKKDSGFYRMFENYWNRNIKLERWKIEKKTFYSFRHHFSDYYKQLGTSPHLVGAILGHQTGTITYDTYGGDVDVVKLKEIIEMFKIDYI
jgi:integrase